MTRIIRIAVTRVFTNPGHFLVTARKPFHDPAAATLNRRYNSQADAFHYAQLLLAPTWKLWVDDQIGDVDTPDRHTPADCIGAESSAQAIKLVSVIGRPVWMGLDHDLGPGDTVMTFLKWLAETYTDGPVPDWEAHSANPIGCQNIDSFLTSWRRSLSHD